jgi:hypothetical protein
MINLTEQRRKTFNEEIKPHLEARGMFVYEDKGMILIDPQNEIGVMDYFPKSNKLRIRKNNSWLENGLKELKERIK